MPSGSLNSHTVLRLHSPVDNPPSPSVDDIAQALLSWGETHFQDFPWREKVPPWQGLLAEVMLQRTRASQVARVFSELIAQFPSLPALGAASDTDILTVLQPLGLNWRLPAILALIRRLCETQGALPVTAEGLEAMPGVGQYAAAATLSMHMNIRAVPLDSNIARILARITGRPFGPETRRARWLGSMAEAITPVERHRAYNYALLDLAMTVCTPRTPKCEICPLASVGCVTATQLSQNRD